MKHRAGIPHFSTTHPPIHPPKEDGWLVKWQAPGVVWKNLGRFPKPGIWDLLQVGNNNISSWNKSTVISRSCVQCLSFLIFRKWWELMELSSAHSPHASFQRHFSPGRTPPPRTHLECHLVPVNEEHFLKFISSIFLCTRRPQEWYLSVRRWKKQNYLGFSVMFFINSLSELP